MSTRFVHVKFILRVYFRFRATNPHWKLCRCD